ncbi:MAG TPA: TonB family protein [Thermoanaerobaculia bacterium]|nr:TonB family protein [Thermoanaerobaculia bacterium]
MAARNKPYEQFGPYLLFKKLDSDALGDAWRAGRIDGSQLGPTVALRRFTAGDRQALVANAMAVEEILPRISGTSFARDQRSGVADGVPYVTWDYASGRSLRHIIDRARGGKETQPNPLPVDQAIVIAEKVALSLATMADLRDTTGSRLSHGALIPQFIWISDDGEIRVGGQQLGPGLIASLNDPKVGADVGRYFSPEYRSTGQVQKNTDVYSLGAILFLLVTGQEPPDAATASAFAAATRAARMMTGTPIPDDIRVILDKSFNLDPSMRFASVGDMKQAISALANGGKYSATTFNLAFYLSSLLKKEMEGEAADREKETKVNLAPYLEAPKAAPVAAASAPARAAAAAAAPAPFMFGPEAEAPKKSKLPLAIAAAVVVAAVGVGAFMMLGKSTGASEVAQVATAQALPLTPKPAPRIISEPIAVTPEGAVTTTAATTTGMTDAEQQKKAFEDAVKAQMQAEMMKLQDAFTAELKRSQSKNAPVASTPPATSAPAPAPAADEQPSMTAAQLDQQRREAQVAETRPVTPAPVTQTAAPQPAVVTATQAPAPAPQVATVREGDVISVGELDVVPRITRASKPVYPPMALRQKVAATVVLTVLISETGEVLDVRVLRGEPRYGINDAAIRAMKATRFSSPMKDGKRVRTWFPQSIEFKAAG